MRNDQPTPKYDVGRINCRRHPNDIIVWITVKRKNKYHKNIINVDTLIASRLFKSRRKNTNKFNCINISMKYELKNAWDSMVKKCSFNVQFDPNLIRNLCLTIAYFGETYDLNIWKKWFKLRIHPHIDASFSWITLFFLNAN